MSDQNLEKLIEILSIKFRLIIIIFRNETFGSYE